MNQVDQGLATFLCAREVMEITGLSRLTIWRLERKGVSPRRRGLSPEAVGLIERCTSVGVAEGT